MSIEELGNIGELIAAVATIVALVYLAIQIRQGNKLLEHEKIRGVHEDADRWRSYLIADKTLATIYREGLQSPEALDHDDQLRFLMIQDQLFFGWQYNFVHDIDVDDRIIRPFLINTLRQPGGNAYWAGRISLFDTSFVEYVEGIKRDIS